MAPKQIGIPIVLSAPSGGGKTTIAQRILGEMKNVVRSISCTTRPAREGESEGKDYFFLTNDQLKRKKKPESSWNGPRCIPLITEPPSRILKSK